MANKLQIKRTTVSGRTPNTTNSGNTHFIDTGELALNLTDGKMFSSNGSVSFEIGANLENIRVNTTANLNQVQLANLVVSNTVTINNDKELAFNTLSGAKARMVLQSDDNLVLYNTDTTGSARVVFAMYANSSTSNLQIHAPLQPLSGFVANGSVGSAGQTLTSNGTGVYWAAVAGTGTVTQVNTSSGLTGGPITGTGTISVVANSGIIANATGLYVNSSYIGTLAANSATYLGGNTALDLRNYSDTQSGTAYTNATAFAANADNISSGTLNALRLPTSVVQNTDSRTLSGNLVISGTSFTPSSNTVLLGNATNRWVLSANTGEFTGTVSHTSTGTTTTGGAQIHLNGATLNRIDFNTNGVAAPAYTTRSSGTKIALYPAISGSSADYALGVEAGGLWSSIPGNDAGQFFKWYGGDAQVGSLSGTGELSVTGAANAASHIVGSNFIANSTALISTGYANVTTSVNSALLTVGTAFIANSTAIVGTGYANVTTSVNSALLTVGTAFIANTTGAYHAGIVNAASHTTTGFVANTTAIAPTSNTVLLGNSIGRFVVSANTGDFSGAITSSGGVNPASNSTGTTLGSSTARWILNANSGNFTANIAMNSNYITGLSDPTNAQDAATKAYVDTFQQGLHIHASAAAATTDTLATLSGGTVTYNNGTAGVGATLTLSVALTTLDGYTLINGDRIIVKDQANTAHNGIYTRTSSTILTRATDFDTGVEMAGGDFTFVTNGTLYNSTGWVQIDEVTTVGTDPVVFQQFSGQGTFTAGQYLYLIGSQFNANATSTSSASVLIARDASQNFAANTANLVTLSLGSISISSNGLIANATTIAIGNTSVNVTITPSTIDIGTSFDANTTGLYHTGVVNAASHTTTGFVANTTAIAPTSNTILLGNSIGRFVISANTGNFTGLITGSAGLTITGQVNASTGFGSGTVNATSNGLIANATNIVVGNSTINVAITPTTIELGGQFDANSTGLYHTGTVNAASHTVGASFIANSTAIVGTGFANVTTSVNSALLTVGTSFIANTTGAYHTGVVNAASHRTTGFVANTTAIAPTSNTILLGNTVGRFIVSANTIDASGDVAITSSTASGNNSTGALKVTGGVGVGDSVYVKNRVGFTNSTNISVVYQVYNVTTNSLDTVFG